MFHAVCTYKIRQKFIKTWHHNIRLNAVSFKSLLSPRAILSAWIKHWRIGAVSRRFSINFTVLSGHPSNACLSIEVKKAKSIKALLFSRGSRFLLTKLSTKCDTAWPQIVAIVDVRLQANKICNPSRDRTSVGNRMTNFNQVPLRAFLKIEKLTSAYLYTYAYKL